MKIEGMVLIPESIRPFTPAFVSSNCFTALRRSEGGDVVVGGGGEGVAIGDDIVVNELRKVLELKEEISD
jgi:hypothetical protein